MTKKKRPSNNLEVDRLSSLPDDLLHHILSFLDTKDVLLTGILSSRWRDLSTSVPNLHFYSPIKHRVQDSFIRFVDRALTVYCSAPTIQKLRICFPYDEKYASNVDEWIRFAVRKGVQELDLDFPEDYYDELYELPSCLLNCETLVSLRLKNCRFGVFDFNKSFSKLTALSLTCEYIEQVLIDDLLKGFPLLEDFAITSYCHALEIRSSSSSNLQLKRLTIDACHVLSVGVDAPNLQTLNICTGSFGMFSFKDMAFLRKACIDVSYPLDIKSGCISSLEVSLQNLCHAEVLNLSSTCVQVMLIPTFSDLQPYFFKAKCLLLKTGVKNFEMPGIANLLWSSPDLENLIIDLVPTMCIYDKECLVKYDFDERYYWESLKATFPCLVHHLKTIKITGFMGRSSLRSRSVRGLKEQIQLMKFLLKNSMVLEEMSIHISRRPEFINEKQWLEIKLKVTRCLVAIPRPSPRAMVLFYDE